MSTEVSVGNVFGNLVVLEKMPDHINKSGRRYARFKVKCKCGNESEINDVALIRTRVTPNQCWECAHAEHIKFRVGDTFDQLTIRRFEYTANRRMAICACSCGNEIALLAKLLETNKTNNCGCKPRGHWEGVGDLSGAMFHRIREGAKSRGIDFQITKEYLWELFENQGAACALSGVPITLVRTPTIKGTASLDRVDSSGPYCPGNVQWVHKDVNKMKQDLDERVFLAWCTRIHENHPARSK